MSTALRYIAVEGPIGVGKTTLAHRLAETFNARLLLERPEENPFLDSFYRDPKANALITQLAFLLQRVRQLDDMRERDLFPRPCVADFMFEKDALFAELTLDDADLRLYRQLYDRLQWSNPRPDKVIYLHAPVETLLERVRLRARRAEETLRGDYLQRVSETYRRFFARYNATPVVVVDAARLDLKTNDDNYRQLLDALTLPDQFVNLPSPAIL